MWGMKLQYRISTLLLMTAATAITFGALLVFQKFLDGSPAGGFYGPWYLLYLYGFSASLWLPVVFVSVALTRKSLTMPMVIVFGIAEAAALVAAFWFLLHGELFLRRV